MVPSELLKQGESSKVQFKERLPNIDSIAQEIIAFSNTKGGIIIIGINDKTGNLNGLSFSEIQSANQLLVNVATNNILPPVFITTETVPVDNHNLLIVSIDEGISKPYKDRNGTIYLKNGSDKRKVTSNDEIARLLQSSKVMFADELPVAGTSVSDIDQEEFERFIQRKYKRSFDELGIHLLTALQNLNLARNSELTLAGLLFFSKNRQKFKPQFSIQCVSVNSTVLTGNLFEDNEAPITGSLSNVFDKAIGFIDRNMKKSKQAVLLIARQSGRFLTRFSKN